MKIVAFVPAKGSSNRIPSKNTVLFNGEPLFVYTVRKLLNCEFIDEVYVDSECSEILSIAENIGAKILVRSPSLSCNKTDGNVLFYNEVSQVEADVYIQHLCTSPFIKETTIKKCVDVLYSSSHDSSLLGSKQKNYHWSGNNPTYDINNIPNSIDLPDDITEAMGLYVVKSKSAHDLRRRIGNNPKMIFGEPTELIDINTPYELKLARTIAAGILADEEKKLRIIGRFLSSPILSDVADELGIDCVLPPEYKPNINGTKIFGRARPLHIREAGEKDNELSIYEALQSYRHVVSNDVIVVKNERPELAYFGDLNMSLAIRSGAIGAVVAGVTRDNRATSNAGFPVFAKGKYCKDIKGRGAVESINQPIIIDDISIKPSDLIFADEDGVVVIPRKVEKDFLLKSLKKISNENQIISEICKDADVDTLIEKFGFF